MSQQAQIIAYDGASTPVQHTLVPTGVQPMADGGYTADWREMSLSLPANVQINARMTKRILKSGIERVALELRIPVQETISGANASGYTAAPKIAHILQGGLVFYFNERATPAERRLIRQLLLNMGGGVVTSVTPIMTHDASQLVDLSVFPS